MEIATHPLLPANHFGERDTVASQIQDILDSNEHPYSRLNRLCQKGAISALVQEKDTTVPGNAILITAQDVGAGHTFTARCSASSLKVAKEKAAQDLLLQVSAHLLGNMPTILQAPIRADILTNGEVKQRAEDELHTKLLQSCSSSWLQEMYNQYATSDAKPFTRIENIGILSVDLEMWERDPNHVNLEVGISVLSLSDLHNHTKIKTVHFINSSNRHHTNLLPGLNKRYSFGFGSSEMVSDGDMKEQVQARILELTSQFTHVYLVGHSIAGDVKWLQNMGFTFMEGMTTLDIAKVYRWAVKPIPYNLFSMEKMLRGLNLEYHDLHNAGNDACYSIVLFAYLAVALAFGWLENIIKVEAY